MISHCLLRTIGRPFSKNLQIDVKSDSVPCDSEFRYILRVYGLTGEITTVEWTPPSCVFTTKPPTTTMVRLREEEEVM